MQVLPSFKNLWVNRQRCIIPVAAYKERPNMEDAPIEFRKKEYEVLLKEPRYFAGLYDDWVSKKTGEVLESCTIITVSSKGNSIIESIWHERMPVLLNEDESEMWLNRELNANSVEQLIKQDNPESLEILEVVRQANPNLFE